MYLVQMAFADSKRSMVFSCKVSLWPVMKVANAYHNVKHWCAPRHVQLRIGMRRRSSGYRKVDFVPTACLSTSCLIGHTHRHHLLCLDNVICKASGFVPPVGFGDFHLVLMKAGNVTTRLLSRTPVTSTDNSAGDHPYHN